MTSPNTIIADLTAEVESLRKQRDELLAAIEEICWLRPLGFRETKYSLAVEKAATKAIASVKCGS